MADPRAPTEHIGSQRAHTQALHLMMQLGSRRAGGCLLRAHGRRAVPADTQGGLRALGGGRGALHATATAAGRARPRANHPSVYSPLTVNYGEGTYPVLGTCGPRRS